MAESQRAAEELQKLRDELQQVSQQAGSSSGTSEEIIAKHAEEVCGLLSGGRRLLRNKRG